MRKIPEYAYFVLDRIRLAGYEAYIVGGAVRDLYLNREIKDIDINTNLLPEQIKELFSDCEQSTRGEKHGTITIIVENKYNRVEVTTYRIDGEYKDSRHPENIDFNADLFEDLSRRDFTMNAMCYDGYGSYVDVFNSRIDIDNKLIRVIGDGNKRFGEDALRIMRGIRFVSQLGFTLDDETKKSMSICKDNLYDIAYERINLEFFDIVRGEHSAKAIKDMLECEILSEHINKLNDDDIEIYSKAKSFHLRLFLLLRHTYNNEGNVFFIGKKRSAVFAWLEKNIKIYEKGLPTNRNHIKNIIHVNGARNVNRLAEYLVITGVQPEIILTLIDDVRHNWSKYGSSSHNTNNSSYNISYNISNNNSNLAIVNMNKYIEYNNEPLAITKEILLKNTIVTEDLVDEIYEYLFNCVRCKNFINEKNELIIRANAKIDKINNYKKLKGGNPV